MDYAKFALAAKIRFMQLAVIEIGSEKNNRTHGLWVIQYLEPKVLGDLN